MHFPSPDDPHVEDGFTGRTLLPDRCKACGYPMISREYKFGHTLLWSTTHATDECEEMAFFLSRNLKPPQRLWDKVHAKYGKTAVRARQPAADME